MSNAESEGLAPVEDDLPPSLAGLVRAAHRGERSLGETYWLWLVVPGLVARAALYMLTLNSLPLLEEHLFYVFVFAIEFVFLGWLYYFGIGVFRSARHAESRFWGVVACLLVGLGFVVSPVRVGADLLSSFGIGLGSASLQSQVDVLNAQLPRRIDAVTTLLHVDYSGEKIVFQYRVDPSVSRDSDWLNIDRRALHDTCGTYRGQFEMGGLVSVNYRYALQSGEVLHEAILDRTACSRENLAKVSAPLTGEKLLAERVALINRGTPQRLDRVTTLTRAWYADKVLYMEHRLDTNQINLVRLRNALHDRSCKTYKDLFAKGEISRVEFRYLLPDDPLAKTISFDKWDCPSP